MTILSKQIRNAASLLLQGKLVALPTETVYGLAGNALSDQAVASIYATKSRPQFNPLIVHVSGIEEAYHYGTFSENALSLARHFWPGPLTLVLPRRIDCKLSLLVSAGLDTVAIRVPAHPLAQALLHECHLPLAAPSANRSGKVSPTLAAHVKEELGSDVSLILDGGACIEGIESTVIDMTHNTPVLLRPGSISTTQINVHINDVIQMPSAKTPITSPGMLESHYAPHLPVRLNATDVQEDEALLAYGAPLPGAKLCYNLSAYSNIQQAAANLFHMLRSIDAQARQKGFKQIAVMRIPEDENENSLGIAINDRLKRAAAPRN